MCSLKPLQIFGGLAIPRFMVVLGLTSVLLNIIVIPRLLSIASLNCVNCANVGLVVHLNFFLKRLFGRFDILKVE